MLADVIIMGKHCLEQKKGSFKGVRLARFEGGFSGSYQEEGDFSNR